MRYLPILGLLLSVLASCSTKETVSVEPEMTLDSLLRLDRSYLETYFGTANLRDTVIGNKDVTLLYPGTTRELRLFWYDKNRYTIEDAETGPKRDTIGYWKTTDGIHVGMRLKAVEAKNEAPFNLNHSSDKRIYTDFLKTGKLPAGVTLFFDPYNINQHYGFTSASQQISSVNPRVIGIKINKVILSPKMNIRIVQLKKGGFEYPIPQLFDPNPARQAITKSINREIRVELGVEHVEMEGKESVDVSDDDRVRWNNDDYSIFHSLTGVYLGIQFHGTYTTGRTSNYRNEYVFFDMSSGDRIEHTMFPLHSLFKPEKYWEFMDKYWRSEFYKRYRAGECTGEMPLPTSCLTSSVKFAFMEDKALKLFTDDDDNCVACMSNIIVDIPYGELKPYLSKWGLGLIWQEEIASKSPHDQVKLLDEKYRPIAPDNLFVSLGGEYDTMSLAIEFYEGDNWSEDDPDSLIALERNKLKGTVHQAEGRWIEGYFTESGMMVEVHNSEGLDKFEFLWADDGDDNSIALDSTYVICNEVVDDTKTPWKILHFTFSRPDSRAAGKAYLNWK